MTKILIPIWTMAKLHFFEKLAVLLCKKRRFARKDFLYCKIFDSFKLF